MATATLDVSLDDDFITSLTRLDPAKSHRVLEAVELLRSNPDHPNLHLKPLHRELDELWSARAGRDVRILLVRRGNTIVLLEAGMRRDVYDRAARGRFVVNPNRRFMGFVDVDASEQERRAPLPSTDRPTTADQPRVFDHWTDAELLAVDITDAEIADLRSCGDEYDLLRLDWPGDRIDLVVQLVETTPEAWRSPVSPDSEARIRRAIAEFGGLTGISPLLSEAALSALAAAPVEDWMIFLHPDQRSIVESLQRGPARVRGAAGTGKTVVALHRAATLARRYEGDGRILFVTVLANLVPVLEALYRRLPEASGDAVAFRAVDTLAAEIVSDATGTSPTVEDSAVDQAFDDAWTNVVSPGSPIAAVGLTPGYVRTEIEKVIKGRGLGSTDEYRSVVRVGRRQGLTGSARSQVWDIAEAWDERMAARGTTSWPDVVLQAAESLRRDPQPRYRAAVVDEAQDLTLAGLQLVRRLVNGDGADRPDGLFLAGDGAQRIQSGGFNLRQAGVEVRGRTTILRVNYRSTREIIEAALDALGGEDVTDLDEEFRRGEQRPSSVRSGSRPMAVRCSAVEDEVRTVAQLAADADSDAAVGYGDVAVLVPAAADVTEWVRALSAQGVPTIPLASYRGDTTKEVKVGSHGDAKGLEFKVVILPELSGDRFPAPKLAGESDDEWSERRSLERSRLFVAMTRARDVLAVTYVGEPAGEISVLVAVDEPSLPADVGPQRRHER